MTQQKLTNENNDEFKESLSMLNKNQWDEYYLKDISFINPKTDDLPDLFNYIDLESVDSGILKIRKIISKEDAPSRAKRVLSKEDILFQTVRPYQKNNLFFNFEDMDYVASTGYAQIRVKDFIYPMFLYYLLHTDKFVNNVLAHCTGTSYPAISSNDLKKIKVKIPNIFTQQKIGNFLFILDKKIELLEKTLVLYQKHIESLKEYLFSKEFDNYIKIKDFLKESNIKTKDTINKRLTVKLNLNGVFPRDIKTSEKEGATTQYLRKSGQFIYGKQSLYKGAFGLIPKNLNNYISSSDIPSFDFYNDQIKPKWFYYFFSRKNYYTKLERLSTGTCSKRISPKEFLNINIPINSLSQQNMEIEILDNLNKKISNIQEEFEYLNKFKKGLLQKMFV